MLHKVCSCVVLKCTWLVPWLELWMYVELDFSKNKMTGLDATVPMDS